MTSPPLTWQSAPDALKVEEAAELVRVGRGVGYTRIRRGDWPYFRVGRLIRIDKRELALRLGVEL
jgi:excisionase family DNA binding protein